VNQKAARLHIWHRRLTPVKAYPPMPTAPSSLTSGGWATAGEEISDDNVLWRQYVLMVDLYRYYIDLVWKVTIWFYTATGLSLAYLFTHLNPTNHDYLPLLLLFLGALAIGISWIYNRVAPGMTQMEEWLEYIAVSLKLPGRPHVDFMRWFCRFISGTLLLVGASCLGFYIFLQT
jgi:hypothetical protein